MTISERWMKILERAQKNGWYPDTRFAISAYDGSVGTSLFLIGAFNDDGVIETWHRDIETLIFQPYFAKALWGERKDHNECTCKGIVAGESHKVDCPTQLCVHCGGRKHIANPTGKCDHVHYPEGCRVCQLLSMNWKDHLQELVLAKNYLEYIESTL